MARKKKRGRRRAPRKRNFIAALGDGLLTVVDMLCEGIAAAVVGLIRALGWVLLQILRGVLALLRLLCQALLYLPKRIWRMLSGRGNRVSGCLKLTGEEFEHYTALVLTDNGYRHVQVTRLSGDQGVDILAERNGKRYAIQCKNYVGAVGNAAVQEAFAGMQYYGCDVAVVVCPGEFTRSARELAQSTGVLLWNGEQLGRMMRISGRRPHAKARGR